METFSRMVMKMKGMLRGGQIPRFPRTAIFGDGTGNDAEGRGSEGNGNGGQGASFPQDPLSVMILTPLYLLKRVCRPAPKN